MGHIMMLIQDIRIQQAIYSCNFTMGVSAKGQENAEFLVGIVDINSPSIATLDIPHYITFRRAPVTDDYRIYLIYSNGGDDIILWNSSASQFEN